MAAGRGLRLVLALGSAPALELAMGVPASPRPLIANQRRTPVVRQLDAGMSTPPLQIERSVRILGVVASPAGLTALDVAAERARVERAVAGVVATGSGYSRLARAGHTPAGSATPTRRQLPGAPLRRAQRAHPRRRQGAVPRRRRGTRDRDRELSARQSHGLHRRSCASSCSIRARAPGSRHAIRMPSWRRHSCCPAFLRWWRCNSRRVTGRRVFRAGSLHQPDRPSGSNRRGAVRSAVS